MSEELDEELTLFTFQSDTQVVAETPVAGFTDSWGWFERRLCRAIDDLEPQTFLIANGPDGIYVQVARDPVCLWCEAVSENYRPHEASALIAARLASDGWSIAGPTDDNHEAVRELPDAAGAAALLVRALHHGFGVASPSEIDVHGGSFPPGPDGGLPLHLAA